MTKSKKRIGVDVGGSHVAAGLIDKKIKSGQSLNLVRKDINAFDTAYAVLQAIGDCINEVVDREGGADVIGIAFPGPFDYENGISTITDVGGKFEAMFGLHVKETLAEITGLPGSAFRFSNDAHCFAAGAHHRHELTGSKTAFLTLGTGFGSAFMENGILLHNHAAIGKSGALYDKEFLNAKADDYFSSRWFFTEYKLRTGKQVSSVKELAETYDDIAASLFHQFGANLGSFLQSNLKELACDELVIGGNIARAYRLFENSLKEKLQESPLCNVIFCDDTEECILTGAALLAEKEIGKKGSEHSLTNKRKATQPLLPVHPLPAASKGYNVFPFMESKKMIHAGFDSLAAAISNKKTVIIDGFGGVLWNVFRDHLSKALREMNLKVFWYHIDACLKPAEEIDKMLADNLNGNDPVFGNKYTGSLVDFFDRRRLELLQPDPAADLCILYGTGADLAGWNGFLVYVEVPKNEIQYRMRAGSIHNLGSSTTLLPTSQMYKRFYFVDWPVLNKHKEQLLPDIDCIADEQRVNEITWMNGDDLRNTLDKILTQPFRARPWFEAGVWGGHWMKKNFKGLNENEVNYAWSIELITPENGIVMEGNGSLLEVSFDFLLFHDNKKLMGKAANRFGKEFPIRFDFLDTYVGGNLSIQCHPRTQYIREKFGENFTQDETYYILDCGPDAKVYLGFQDDIDPEIFKTSLLDAQNKGIELPVEKFIQKIDAGKHDLFLIPNGTVHASGKNNLVLEISSTPYIFTFKMYDWLRPDLNGQPRPLNIEHAFNNLYFDRKGEYVSQHLISKARVVNEWKEGRKINLPTHEKHFYAIDRYEFSGEIEIQTNGQCHICMLVEGKTIEVSADGNTNSFSYAETFVIPAAVEKYCVHNTGKGKAFLVTAYVKDEAC